MTAGNVSSASDVGMAIINVRTGQGNVSPIAVSGASFQSLMSATADKQVKSDVSGAGKNNDSGKFKPKESIKASKTDIDRIVKSDNADTVTVTQDTVAKAGTDVRNAVKEQLGLTDEELDVMLGELGFTVSDLLMPQNVAILVATVNETDVTSIVTDENLADELGQLVTEIAQIVDTAVEGTETTVADFAEELAKLESNVSDGSDTAEIKQDVLSGADEKTATVITKDESSGKEIEVTVENSRTEETRTDIAKAPENTGSDYREESHSDEESRADSRQETAENIVQNLNQAFNESISSVESFTESYRVNTSDIINQMIDAIRVNVTADTTSMEIQLTPENLGKINLNVASKDGVITATITAQNETVKTVIENQIVQLRESLNNQGFKVEQVEVTIASREFSMNQENTSDNGNHNNRQRTRRRFRTDDEITGRDVSMSELMEQQIMETNGNSVSYTA